MDKDAAIRAALNKLGERSADHKSPPYTAALEEWERALLSANAAFPWSFARKYATLQGGTPSTIPGYIQYHLPPDCLAVIHLLHPTTGRRISWRPGGTLQLHTPHTEALLVYNASVLNATNTLPESCPAFAEYFVALLASRIAPSILGGEQGRNMSLSLLQEAEQLLDAARCKDAQQWASNDEGNPYERFLYLNS